MARRLEVEFVGDTRSLERAFKRADNASDKSKGKFAAVGAVAGRAAKGGILDRKSVV